MDVARDLHYDADVAAVVALLISLDFQRQRAEAAHALGAHASVEPADASPDSPTITVSSVQKLPTDRVPDFVRSFIGRSIDLNETTRWGPPEADGAREAEVRITVAGAPVTITARRRLVPEGPHATRETVRGRITAAIPFVGRKVEGVIEPIVMTSLASDERLAARHFSS